jgi:hypothetical protein
MSVSLKDILLQEAAVACSMNHPYVVATYHYDIRPLQVSNSIYIDDVDFVMHHYDVDFVRHHYNIRPLQVGVQSSHDHKAAYVCNPIAL